MNKFLFALTFAFLGGAAATMSAASVCPMTAFTSSDCNFLITIGANGSATVSTVLGSSPFNGPINFVDGTSDPGSDGSLIGVINNSSMSLSNFTLLGSGANAGIFDFSFNGICVYTSDPYCASAGSGYEGPTTTFSDLQSTVLFQTTEGDVSFAPTLAAGQATYFAIENTATDINANGGLTVSNVTFASVPEPADYALLGIGLAALGIFRRKLTKLTD